MADDARRRMSGPRSAASSRVDVSSANVSASAIATVDSYCANSIYFSPKTRCDARSTRSRRGEPIPPKMTDGRADRGYTAPGDDDDFRALGFDPMAYVPPGQAPPGFE